MSLCWLSATSLSIYSNTVYLTIFSCFCDHCSQQTVAASFSFPHLAAHDFSLNLILFNFLMSKDQLVSSELSVHMEILILNFLRWVYMAVS